MPVRSLMLLVALAAAPFRTAPAQQGDRVPTTTGAAALDARRACLGTAAPGLFRPMPVYLTYSARQGTPEAATSMLRLLVQDAASRIRERIGAVPGTLPTADGRIDYFDLDVLATVRLSGDGTALVAIPAPSSEDETRPDGVRALLLSTLRLAADSGGPFRWSDSASDSVRAQVSFTYAGVGPDGPFATTFEFGVPVFSMRMPIETPVTLLVNAPPAYPPAARAAGVEAEVAAEFVVGADGRADVQTFRVTRTSADPPMMEDQFVAAVRESLPRLRFDPARLAGCPVRQLVKQSFAFTLQ